jgi:hypothetical protein
MQIGLGGIKVVNLGVVVTLKIGVGIHSHSFAQPQLVHTMQTRSAMVTPGTSGTNGVVVKVVVGARQQVAASAAVQP